MSRAEPIAIVGLSCRLPTASGREALWRLLCDDADAITEFPSTRLGDWAGDPGALPPGGFIDDVEGFDAAFFGVLPRDASMIDPHERLLLELAWEALEDAGIDPVRARGPIGLHAAIAGPEHADGDRLAGLLGIEGPREVLGGGHACSLVAVHEACESLLDGRSRLALAGGVSLLTSPLSILRPIEGGAPRGEGGAVVLLRPLAHAIEAGDRIHAVIRASAVSDDGLQQAIAGALEPAGLQSSDVGPAAAGSLKTKIGDLEAAAGIAELAEAVLCVQHRELIAGVSSQRAAGVSSQRAATSCHLLLAPAPEPEPGAPGRAAAGVVPWLLSGHDEAALRAQARRLRAHVSARPLLEPVDVGWSLATGRARLARRALVAGAEREDLLAGLGAVAAGVPASGVARGTAGSAPRIAFVFPGQGSQWPGMALELWRSSPVFAERIEACEAALSPYVDWTLQDVLRAAPGDPLWERSDVVQPALFCVMVSLAELWGAHGVRPAAVVGHSLGEISAACVAGILSLDDAARVAALTSRALAVLGGDDGMALVSLEADDLAARIARVGGRLTLAAFNGPRALVVAGEQAALDELLAGCEADGVRARRIRVDGTSSVAHSAQIEAIREQLARDLAPVVPRPSEVAFYSSISGEPVEHSELGPEYWYRSLREPVRFEQATRALVRDGVTAFVESSPHPVLTFAVEGTVEVAAEDAAIAVIGSLRRDEGGLARFTVSLGEAYACGIEVDFAPAFAGARPRRVELPCYAFQRRRYPPGEPLDEPVRAPAQPAGGSQSAVAPGERETALLDVVRAQAAAVLGRDPADAIGARRAFRELGMDSLQGVELRNRLAQLTSLRLPSTLVYDHPTPAAVARQLSSMLAGARPGQQAVVRARAHADEPIAIVGMSCRYPGGVTSARELWELVAQGTAAVGPFPTDRGWDLERLYDPDPDRAGCSYVRAGGFLYDAGDFDAAFFGIPPREARAMDPQQRIALETAWAALEDAAIDPQGLHGSATAVFMGISSQDYGSFLPGVATDYEGLRMTGCLTSVVSGRVSYALGLQGPAVTIDTACSSSLVALHLACQALRGGECSLALAGGVTVLSSPGMFVEFSRQRGLARDGLTKAFAAAADGASWAEGAGVLVVERLSDARRHGHRVLGLVRGSATNQDGASNGLSAPNGPSQERVILQALANAGLAAGDVDAVEAHGTGTTLGDPIEAQALLATYGRQRTDGPLRLGSIKSNIGHSHAAAGVAGVIKMVMSMREELLPATLHVDAPTPHVDWSAGEIELLTEALAWPRTRRPRRAGVSGFGISGTNAHVVLEEAPAEQPAGSDGADGEALPWVLSAKTDEALREQARLLRAHVDARPRLDPVDVGWSLAVGRARLARRAVVAGADRQALLAGLDAVIDDRLVRGVAVGTALDVAKVAFVFPGQGSQWLGMALELWDSSATFGERMDACAAALRPFVDWELRDVLSGAEGAPPLERTDIVQPASFAVFVSLAALWRSYGVEPAVVIGHSQGEIAAAHVCGALSLQDAARVAALRARALMALDGAGGMMSVFEPASEVLERIGRWDGRLVVGSYNSPRSTVVTGDLDALEELRLACADDHVRTRRVAIDYASHSSQIDAVGERLLEDLRPVVPQAGTIPMLSTTTGAPIDGAELGAGHWLRNVREPVRFHQTVRALIDDGVTAFVECSPHPVLTWAVNEMLDDAGAARDDVTVVGSLRKNAGTLARFLASAGEAYAGGVEVDWTAAFAGRSPRRVELPTYPFERTRFWLHQQAGTDAGEESLSAAGVGSAEHPLLGAAVALAGEDRRLLTGRLSLGSHPWLADHELRQQLPLPGAAFVEIVLRAGAEVGCDTIEELALAAALLLPAQGGVQLQATIGEPDASGRRGIDVHARPDGDQGAWTLHASATVSAAATKPHDRLETWPPAGAEPVDVDALYDRLAGQGRAYGPAFQAVRAAWRLGAQTYAEIALDEEQAADGARFAIHPALLDAALHASEADEPRIATSWSGVRVQRPGALAARVRVVSAGPDALCVSAVDEAGEPVFSVDAIVSRPLAVRPGAPPDTHDALYRVRWTALPAATGGDAPARLAAIGDVPAPGAERFADLGALRDALAAGGPLPSTVLVAAPPGVAATLELLQERLGDERLRETPLAVITRDAVAALDGEAPDADAAAIRGLLRSAQSEHPGRFVAIDIDDEDGDALARALATGEPDVAIRGGAVLVPRLVRAPAGAAPAGAWRLAPERAGVLIAAGPVHGDGDRALADGEVRLAVRAAGVNFRDVLIAIGVYARPGEMGIEGAGVVVEVGPGVADLALGDRVMGFVPGAFGPLAVADHRLLVAVPGGWSFAQAASVCVAHATARHTLVDVAGLQPGERVLIHAAAGGVGHAAVRLAQQLGAEVFATAGPSKWGALADLGIDEQHVASSRSTEFGARFSGPGIDVVLNCLTGELTDASLGLLTNGGRFVELGTADVRDAAAVAAAHPGVRYETIELFDLGPQRLGELLRDVAERAQPLPVTAWDVRDGSAALQYMSQARHVGKVVLTVPHAIDPGGTVLVTGGTGGLGALFAEHLAREHGVRHMLLAGRRGPDAPGAAELRLRLRELGCEATAVACDVGDRAALAGLLSTIDPDRPLTAVVHAAGTFADAMIESLDPAAIDAVMRPKACAAGWLDELTAGLDLAAFVLFSSVAATFGLPGQGNYAAANAYLDALAQRRRARGLAATSVAWGVWESAGMSSRLAAGDAERLRASARQHPMAPAQALAMLDAALGHRDAALVAVPLDLATLRADARSGTLPALLSELVRAPARRGQAARAGAGGSLAGRLATVAEDERDALVLDLVREQAAAALGHASADAVAPERSFKELGFDSLGSVVLRNRLSQMTGLRLPSTLVFDHPTPIAMAAFLRSEAEAETGAPQPRPAAPAPGPAPAPAQRLDIALAAQPHWQLPAPSTNGAGGHGAGAVPPDDADRRYGGRVLSSIAGAVRGLRFRAWVLLTRARLARLGCRLVVETDGTPRFEGLPHVVIDTPGDARGSLTLRIGRDCRIGRELTLDLWTHADGVIEIGDRCHLQDRIRLQPWGGAIRLAGQVLVRDGVELKSRGELVIGAEVGIGRHVTVHCHERIELADHVALAEGVQVMDSDHTHDGSDTHFQRQRVVSSPVLVSSNVFVGTNALILRGSRVGPNAVVATGAVLTGGEYPAGHLLAGVPAQALRPLAPEEPIPS